MSQKITELHNARICELSSRNCDKAAGMGCGATPHHRTAVERAWPECHHIITAVIYFKFKSGNFNIKNGFLSHIYLVYF